MGIVATGSLGSSTVVVLAAVLAVNTFFLLRNGHALLGMRSRRLSLRKRDVFDLFTHLVVYYCFSLSTSSCSAVRRDFLLQPFFFSFALTGYSACLGFLPFFLSRTKPIQIVTREESRRGSTFRVVAAFTLGLCWIKVLAFLAALHMKFAVYVQALVHIADSLRSFIVLLLLVVATFANMFWILLSSAISNESEDDDVGGEDDNEAFKTVPTSFLSLFQ